MKRSLIIPLAIALGGGIIAGAVYISMPKSSPESVGRPELVRPVSTSDHILGNPAAPVLLVVYSDFACSFCKDFHETLLRIIANEGSAGKVAIVYRQFPLSELHENSLSHAKAAECIAQVAGNLAFWRFADALYKKQPVSPLSYGEIASMAGISNADFATCFANVPAAINARIMADRQNALDIGAEGTPYSLILVVGKPPVVMKGAFPYDAIQQRIAEALK